MKRCVLLALCAFMMLGATALAEEFIITQEGASDTVQAEGPADAEGATPVPLPEGLSDLRLGQQGDAVRVVQQRLFDLGYYAGEVHGAYDEATAAAVSAFQGYNGLAETGKVNATTWFALMSLEAVRMESSTLSPLTTPSPEGSESPIALGEVPALSRTLRYEDRGEEVRLLQQRLLELGYYQIEVSGNFLGNTRSAVRAFQEKHRLGSDGIVGEKTWAALFSEEAIPADGEPLPLQYMLTVDVTNQITYAYALDENGEHTVLVRRMICSTGMKGWETPLKTTQSKGDRARWGYFPKWGSYAQYLTRIDSLNAFHSVLYRRPDIYTLNETSYNKLGEPASHGCVRLLVEDAKWIYDNCPNGTTITVYEGGPDPELTEMLKPPPLDRSTMSPSVAEPRVFPEVFDRTAFPEARLLRKGATGDDVWWLQSLLSELGYYSGTVSGGYYGGTMEAVRAFQRDQGLSADGLCGELTWARLREAAAALTAAAPTEIPDAIPVRPPEGVAEQTPEVTAGAGSTPSPQATTGQGETIEPVHTSPPQGTAQPVTTAPPPVWMPQTPGPGSGEAPDGGFGEALKEKQFFTLSDASGKRYPFPFGSEIPGL